VRASPRADGQAKRKVHLIFKTHLDIGFTDYAARVCRQYHDHFLPMAMATAEHLWREDPGAPKFVWTTGAWLIHEHLEKGGAESRKRLEEAIRNGTITWHALPYTTHTELLSADLFRAGLGYGQALDRRFGRRTTGAKMTDVPGHTRGLIPLLARAGIRFLHIGVNSASTVPDVPPVFRWQAPGGDEIVVMYQNDYGTTFFPDGMADGIGFAHTHDNVGPQSIAQAVETHRLMALQNPGAEIVASTLSAYGDLLWERRATFPVVTDEIGDSWIHGVGSAPRKVSRYLGLRRLYGAWARQGLTPQRLEMGRRLCMVAEHTWGVDIKTFLRDDTAWDRVDFERARAVDPRFALTEQSWHEQDALIDDAMSVLTPADRADATVAAQPVAVARSAAAVTRCETLSLGDGLLDLDPGSGALRSVRFPNAQRLECGAQPMFALSYESYDAADVQGYMDDYMTKVVYWSVQDQGKPGLDRARTAQSGTFHPDWLGAAGQGGDLAVARFRFTGCATEELGAPPAVEIRYRFAAADTLEVTAALFDKPANRMPEASFLSFAPKADAGSWRFEKLGDSVDPTGVLRNGNRQLHAVEAVTCRGPGGQRIAATPLDSVLAGPAAAPFMRFDRGEVSMRQGVRFCLHNNKWGTNFPMWCEGDLVFRVLVRVTA